MEQDFSLPELVDDLFRVLASSGILPPFNVYQSNIKSRLILDGQVKLAAADKRYFGRHDRQELDVGIEWQTRHVQHGARYVMHIKRRFHLD
jgi:hypothetical protein